MAVLFALAAALLYGAADFLGATASRRMPALAASALSQAVGLALLAAALPFARGHAAPADLGWGAIAGVTGGLGVLLLYRALAGGTVSTLAPVISLIAIAVPVAAGVAGGERLGVLAAAGIVAGALGVAMVGAGEARDGAVDAAPSPVARRLAAAVPPVAIASGVLIGGFLVALGRIAAGSGLLPLVVARGTGTLVLAAALAARGGPPRLTRGGWALVAGCAAADVAANLGYLLAVQRGPLSVMATIVSLAPASTVVLAQVVLRERLGVVQKAGVALALLAAALLAGGGTR